MVHLKKVFYLSEEEIEWLGKMHRGLEKEPHVGTIKSGMLIDGTEAKPIKNDIIQKWLASRKNVKNIFEYVLKSGLKYTVASDGAAVIRGVPDAMPRLIEILIRVFKVSSLDAIKAVTMNAADCRGILDETGTLKLGKYSNLIAVKENPIENIKALMNVNYLMKAGRQYNWVSGKSEEAMLTLE